MERCTLGILALVLVSCVGGARCASAATVAGTPEVIDSLRADLVALIERDAQKLENVCNASALVTAIRVAPGDVVVRLRERVRRVVAPALVSGQPDCLVDIAARLVPLVPDTDKRKLIASLASFYEKGIKAYALYRAVMPSIAPHLTAEESARFARVARAEPASSCLRTRSHPCPPRGRGARATCRGVHRNPGESPQLVPRTGRTGRIAPRGRRDPAGALPTRDGVARRALPPASGTRM